MYVEYLEPEEITIEPLNFNDADKLTPSQQWDEMHAIAQSMGDMGYSRGGDV